MTGHLGFVLGVGFSPDSTRLYSCSIEGDIHVWDPTRRVRLEIWQGCHAGPILGLAVADTGEVVSAGLDGSIGIWSPGGELVQRLTGHRGGVHAVAVGASTIASASADGTLALWRRDNGELIRTFEGHEEAVTSVAFLGDDALVSGSRDRTVRLWEVAGSQPPSVFRGHRWWVTKVAPVAGGRFVSTSEDCTLRLWERTADQAIWTFEGSPGPIWGLAIEPGGAQAVVGYGGDTSAVDLITREAVPLPKVAPVSSRAIAFSADGALLALGSDHGDVDVLDRTDGDRSGKLAGNGYPVLSGVVRPNLLATGRVSGAVRSITAADGVTDHAGHDFFTYCCRGLADGLFASGGFDQRVRLWRPGQVEEVGSADHGGLVFSLDWDSTGGRLLAAGWDQISLLSLPDLRVLWRLESAGVGPHLVTTFAGGNRIAGVGEAPILKVWSDGEEIASYDLPDARSCVIEGVPGQPLVVVGSAYGRVSLVNVETGASQPLHGEHEDWIRVLRVAGDGNRVLSISQNGSARLFDRVQNRIIERFERRPIAIGDFDADDRLHWLDCLGVVGSDSAPD